MIDFEQFVRYNNGSTGNNAWKGSSDLFVTLR